MDIPGILGIIGAFSIAPVIIYLRHRNRERMKLIEKGVSSDILAKAKKDFSITAFKYGILSVGLAVGILAGNILAEYTYLVEEAAYLSMIFLFGGSALLIFYFMTMKKKEKKDDR